VAISHIPSYQIKLSRHCLDVKPREVWQLSSTAAASCGSLAAVRGNAWCCFVRAKNPIQSHRIRLIPLVRMAGLQEPWNWALPFTISWRPEHMRRRNDGSTTACQICCASLYSLDVLYHTSPRITSLRCCAMLLSTQPCIRGVWCMHASSNGRALDLAPGHKTTNTHML